MSLDNILHAEGALIVSDLHGNYGAFRNALEAANDNNYALLYNGDATNDYLFREKLKDLGYKLPREIAFEYMEQKAYEEGSGFGKNDLDTYKLILNLQATGGDISPFLEATPKEQHEDLKKMLQGAVEYYQSDLYQKKLENLVQNLQQDRGEEIHENLLRSRALYEIIIDEEARVFAEHLNEHEKVTVLYNDGNHEPFYFVEKVKGYLNNKDQIVHLNEREGFTRIKDNIGNIMSIAGLTNCSHYLNHVIDIYHPQEIDVLYQHMSVDENRKKAMLQGAMNEDDVKAREDLISQDKDYQRIKKGEEGESLDVFLTHGQVGSPKLSNGRQGFDVPYLGSAAKLSLESKLTVEGHIHDSIETTNSFGKPMIRAAGEKAAILKKNGEKINVDWITIDENFNGNHNNPIPYDNKYLMMRVEDLVKQYKLLEQEVANEDTYAKAA